MVVSYRGAHKLSSKNGNPSRHIPRKGWPANDLRNTQAEWIKRSQQLNGCFWKMSGKHEQLNGEFSIMDDYVSNY
jgi:hypothetical protein